MVLSLPAASAHPPYCVFIVLFSVLFSAELNLSLLCLPLLFVFMVGIVLSSKIFVIKELYKCILFSMLIFFYYVAFLVFTNYLWDTKTFVVNPVLSPVVPPFRGLRQCCVK